MDGGKLIADQANLSCPKTNQATLDNKGQKCSFEISGERQEMKSPQESSDGDPKLGRESIPLREVPDRSGEKDYGRGRLTQKGQRGQSQQTLVPESVHNSTPLRKQTHQNSQCLTGQDPCQPSPRFVSLQTQMTFQMDHVDELSTKEEMTWIRRRARKVMKFRSSQTSRIGDLKSLFAILHPLSNHKLQVSRDSKKNEQSRLKEMKAFSEGSKTGQPARQESQCSDQTLRQQELSNSGQSEAKLHWSEEQHPQDAQELRRQSMGQRLQNQNEKQTGQEPAKSLGQPINGTEAEGNQKWISTKTGLEMTCRSQQTKRSWEFKPLSEISQPPLQEHQKSSDLRRAVESRPETEHPPGQKLDCRNLQAEEPELQNGPTRPKEEPLHYEDQHLQGCQEPVGQLAKGKKPLTHHKQKSEFPREVQSSCLQDSQHTTEKNNLSKEPEVQAVPFISKPYEAQTTNEAVASREPTWISPQTGLEMKCRSQQTGAAWEANSLSEILQAAGQASQKSNKLNEMTEEYVQHLLDCGSKTNREMTGSYTEGEDEVQPTYSLISLEEGIMFNNETHKILLCRSQQTTKPLFQTMWGEGEGCQGQDEEPSVEEEQSQEQGTLGRKESGRQLSTSQQSHQHSQDLLHAKGEELKCDEVEAKKIPNGPHASDEVLFQIESSFAAVDDDLPSVYEEEDGGKEGSFVNTQTGKQLESQCLQTDLHFFQSAGGEAKVF